MRDHARGVTKSEANIMMEINIRGNDFLNFTIGSRVIIRPEQTRMKMPDPEVCLKI